MSQAPGVIVTEEQGTPSPIRVGGGRFFGLVGGFPEGPVDVPTFVSSSGDIQRIFGLGGASIAALSGHVAFASGSEGGYVVRSVADDAAKALGAILGSEVLTGIAIGDGSETDFDFSIPANVLPSSFRIYAGGKAAKGEIQAIAAADHVDGETFSLSDPNQTVTFEFRASGSVTEGNVLVPLPAGASDTVMAAIIANVINASALDMSAAALADSSVVTFGQNKQGASGNTSSSEAVADAGFTVDDAAGGADISEAAVNASTGVISGVADGTIDFSTGTVSVVFDTAPASGVPVIAVYQPIFATINAKWEGVYGDSLRLDVEGDTATDTGEGSFAEYTLSVVRTYADGSESVMEVFTGISFTDPASEGYAPTVVNDVVNGSDLIELVATGSNVTPDEITGAYYDGSGASLYPESLYDGSEKAFTYAFGEAVWPGSLSATMRFAEVQSIGASGATVYSGTLAGGSVVAGEVAIGDGTSMAYDDGEGGFTGDVSAVPGSSVIDYETGEFTVTFASTVAGAVFSSHMVELVVTDDALGNVDGAGSAKYALDASVDQTIDYLLGVMSLTFVAAPAFGTNSSPHTGSNLPMVSYAYANYAVGAQESDFSVRYALSGGADGSALSSGDVVGATAEASGSGVYALESVLERLTLLVPDFEADAAASIELLAYCKSVKNRFIPLSVPQGMSIEQAVVYRQRTLGVDNAHGALYYNHIRVTDLVTRASVLMPIGPHAAGRYAATARAQNVAKAPAGVRDGALQYAIGVEFSLTEGQVGILDAAGINPVVDWAKTGRCIWGDQTLARTGDIQLIQHRLTYMELQDELGDASLQSVFGNNNEALWSATETRFELYLLSKMNQGYFAGNTPETSFYVDARSRNTAGGRTFTTVVGVALAESARFVELVFTRFRP